MWRWETQSGRLLTGTGLVLQSVVAYWFSVRFGVKPALLGARLSPPRKTKRRLFYFLTTA